MLLAFIILPLSGEYSYDKQFGSQIGLIFNEPVKRRAYHKNKLSSIFVATLFPIFAILVLIFILGVATEGIGAYNYPVVEYTELMPSVEALFEHFKLNPLWLYLLKFFLVMFIGNKLSFALNNVYLEVLSPFSYMRALNFPL